MNTVDLHVHSDKSDGTFSPASLVSYAAKKGLTAFALTDHDTTDGIEEAVCAAKIRKQAGKQTPEVIPGIEFSTEYQGKDVHILGLSIDYKNPYFVESLHAFVHSRTLRNEKMCEKLQKAGISITYDALLSAYPDAVITRAHYAGYLLEHGYVKSREEAFMRYIGDRGSCFVPREKVTPTQAVRLIRQAGGVPVLAHPVLYHMSEERLNKLVESLLDAGLAGIEALYSTYTHGEEVQMRALAVRYGLLLCGGSDFHGDAKPGLDMGCGYGKLQVPESIWESIQDWLSENRRNAGRNDTTIKQTEKE